MTTGLGRDSNGKIFNKKCFGYDQDPDGNLIINETEAQTVRCIFDLYLGGYSVIAITRALQKQNIKSPTGKDQWSKRTVETILANEKYTGDVMVLKSYIEEYPGKKRKLNTGEKARYVSANTAPVIITKEKFLMVIEEKERRSNIILTDSRLVRKSTHYSMKKTDILPQNESNPEENSI